MNVKKFRDAVDVVRQEREYAESKWGNVRREVGSWLTIMRRCLSEADEAYTDFLGDERALNAVRKVMAVGLARGEQYGFPKRMFRQSENDKSSSSAFEQAPVLHVFKNEAGDRFVAESEKEAAELCKIWHEENRTCACEDEMDLEFRRCEDDQDLKIIEDDDMRFSRVAKMSVWAEANGKGFLCSENY